MGMNRFKASTAKFRNGDQLNAWDLIKNEVSGGGDAGLQARADAKKAAADAQAAEEARQRNEGLKNRKKLNE